MNFTPLEQQKKNVRLVAQGSFDNVTNFWLPETPKSTSDDVRVQYRIVYEPSRRNITKAFLNLKS